MKIIEPSLLAFDLTKLDSQLKEMKNLGVQYIHYDVMDGIFVPNKAFGPTQLDDIYRMGLLANVHMMVQNPMNWVNEFITHPCNCITFHPEVISIDESLKIFNLLKSHHIKCGVALKVEIDANKYESLLKVCDYVCVMSVEPGKGGQSFIEQSIDNLKKVKAIKNKFNRNLIIQLDGGVNVEVMKKTNQYVDHFVIGSFLMKQVDKSFIFNVAKNL